MFAIMMERFLQHLVNEGYPRWWARHALCIALGTYRSMATQPRTVENLWWWVYEACGYSNYLWFGHSQEGIGPTLMQRAKLRSYVRAWFPYQYVGN